MSEPVFIDTWGWVALGHRNDEAHQAVSGLYRQLREYGALVYTSDYVLDELITLLYRREEPAETARFLAGIFQAADTGYLQVERITPERFQQAWRHRMKFQGKPLISLTDFTTMAVMRDLRIRRIITADRHFSQVGMGLELLP